MSKAHATGVPSSVCARSRHSSLGNAAKITPQLEPLGKVEVRKPIRLLP